MPLSASESVTELLSASAPFVLPHAAVYTTPQVNPTDIIAIAFHRFIVPPRLETDYFIGVHYYEDSGGLTVTSSVAIYVNGELHETVNAAMTHNDFWNVGAIRVVDGMGSFIPSEDDIAPSTIRECEGD